MFFMFIAFKAVFLCAFSVPADDMFMLWMYQGKFKNLNDRLCESTV